MGKLKTLAGGFFKTEGGVLSGKEYWAYGLSGTGQNLLYGIMSSYLMIFYTDVMLIPSATVGTMFLIAKIWDAVNDPLMGSLVDKTRTRWGKVRPYLLFSPVPIAISTILLFVAPDLSMTGRIVYMYTTYMIWGMLYTVGDVPFWSLSAVITPNTQERTKVVSFVRALTAVGLGAPSAIISILFVIQGKGMFAGLVGNSQRLYLTGAVLMSVIGAGLFMLGFFGTKERVPQNEKKPTLKQSLSFMIKNKPLMMILLSNLLNFPRLLIWTAQPYVATYILGGGQWVVVLGIPLTIGTLISYIITPVMMRKFGGIKTYLISRGYSLIPMGLLFFFGYSNLYVILFFIFLYALSEGVTNVVPTVLIGDCVDYIEWQSGQRAEGVSFSVQTFMTKASAALQSLVGGFLLIWVGYQAPIRDTAGTLVEQAQSASTLQGIWAMYTILPAVLSLLCLVPLLFYDLKGEKLETVRRELAEQRGNS